MSPDSTIYLFVALRSVHIAVAALWLGSAALFIWFVLPATGKLAPEIITRLVGRKFHAFMAALGGTAVLSGLLLYWHLTRFSAAGMGSHAGIAFGIGGALGLTAVMIGGPVLGKSAAKIAELYASASAGARSGETSAEIDLLVRRMAGAGSVVVALILAALIVMTLGHYL